MADAPITAFSLRTRTLPERLRYLSGRLISAHENLGQQTDPGKDRSTILAVGIHLDWTSVDVAAVEAEAKELREQAARVRALHALDGGYCATCVQSTSDLVPWPCPTIQALDAPDADGPATTPEADRG